MPLVFSIFGLSPTDAILLGVAIVLGCQIAIFFRIAELKRVQKIEAPSEARLKQAEKAAKAWLDVTSSIAGWKAAIYGALGVVLGTFGGLMADFVTRNHFDLGELERALLVTSGLLALLCVIVGYVEWRKVVERFLLRKKEQREKLEAQREAQK